MPMENRQLDSILKQRPLQRDGLMMMKRNKKFNHQFGVYGFDLNSDQKNYRDLQKFLRRNLNFCCKWDRETFFPKETLVKAGGGLSSLYVDSKLEGMGLGRLDA